MDIYKEQQSNDESQTDKYKMHADDEDNKINPVNIDYWQNKFKLITQKVNEPEISISSVEQALSDFRMSINQKNYPPIEFVIDSINFFFSFLQEPWQCSLKVTCVAIIDCFVTYLKVPFIDLVAPNLINTLLSILLDNNIQQDPYFLKFAYNITKIFKTSSVFSQEFAYALYQSKFLSDFVIYFIVNYDLETIGALNLPDSDCISLYTTFINIIQIFIAWIQLTDIIQDDAVEYLIKLLIEMFKLNNEVIDNVICKELMYIYDKRQKIPLILLETGFFQVVWNAIASQIPIDKGMDFLSNGLIKENSVQQEICNIIDIQIVFNISKKYFGLSKIAHQQKKEELEIILEASIVLIANFLSFKKQLPESVPINGILAFIQDVFNYSNYSVKNCASFLMLELLPTNDYMRIDSIYPNEFLVLFFDTISSGNDEVIEKGIDVFESFLSKAVKCNFDIYQSEFYANFIKDFLENALNMVQFAVKAEFLLRKYYYNDDV